MARIDTWNMFVIQYVLSFPKREQTVHISKHFVRKNLFLSELKQFTKINRSQWTTKMLAAMSALMILKSALSESGSTKTCDL